MIDKVKYSILLNKLRKVNENIIMYNENCNDLIYGEKLENLQYNILKKIKQIELKNNLYFIKDR